MLTGTDVQETQESRGTTSADSFHWECEKNSTKTDQSDFLAPDEVLRHLHEDKSALMGHLLRMQASIAYRAIAACDEFLRFEKEKRGGDAETFLRPRVMIDQRFMTVSMGWSIRLSKTTTSSGKERTTEKGTGKWFTINTKEGKKDVFMWYKYLKKGPTFRYPSSTFKKAPPWAQMLANEIEDVFEGLRKEQSLINEIKRKLMSIHKLQEKQYNNWMLEEYRTIGVDTSAYASLAQDADNND